MPDEIYGVMAVKNGQKQTIMNLSNARQKSYADLQNMTDAQKKGVIVCPDYPKEEFLVTADEVSYGSGTVKDALDGLSAMNYGTAVDLTPYTSNNQYTVPSDGHIYINAYNGNTGVVIINNTIIMGTTSTNGNYQYAFTTFVKKGMKVYVSQLVGSPSIGFFPFV